MWQILPINPTEIEHGNSPYSSSSAFAGNVLLIAPDLLVEEGLLTPSDIGVAPHLSNKRVDYTRVSQLKARLLSTTLERLVYNKKYFDSYSDFCGENSYWIEDYALFKVLKKGLQGNTWHEWPEYARDRKGAEFDRLKKEYREEVEKEKYLQFVFFQQWSRLKRYCRDNDIELIGDIPLYVHYDSADVWAHPEIFKLDARKRATAVAGVPPDYFSDSGQLWGNPVFDWHVLKDTGYEWWVKRVSHNLRLFNRVRLDHFRGFSAFWEVPAGEETAVHGKWVEGPGIDFFLALKKYFRALPFIAEDLGEINEDVRDLRDRFGLPGMRVMQFGFKEDRSSDYHKPHNYEEACVAYTGTHDNNTLIGWLLEKPSRFPDKVREVSRALRYVGCRRIRKNIRWVFIRILMMSKAQCVLFPLQDLVGLGEKARMNRPATARDNWQWRVSKRQLSSRLRKKLLELTESYGRTGI
jgi:4-alpha-glucanotransferase